MIRGRGSRMTRRLWSELTPTDTEVQSAPGKSWAEWQKLQRSS